jgi:hypothetical protein
VERDLTPPFDWARETTAVALGGTLVDNGGATGVAFLWEMQLLATGAASKG